MSLPSHCSPASMWPLPHSGWVVVVEVVVTVELVAVLEVDDVVVVVVGAGQVLKSSVHSGLQVGKAPPAEPSGQVAPSMSVPSHCSPASMWPLPHSGWVVDRQSVV